MSKKKHVLLCDRFSQEAMVILDGQSFLNIEKAPTPSLDKLDLQKYHGLIIRSGTKITESILEKAKNLQAIVTCTSGFDHIDLIACEKWGITVMFTPLANVESASQLTWSLILSCANHIASANQSVHAGKWDRENLVGTELHQKIYGIVGLGRIGQRVADIAHAFGMHILAYDPYCDEQIFRDSYAEKCSYEDLLKRADVVSFHVPKTKETHHMLSYPQLQLIKRGSILINTSRGSVLHEVALVEALQNKTIAACGLDVFESEPLSLSSELLRFPQVVTTPHIGANTTEAFQKASESAALKMIRFFLDSSTSDTLPPKAAWYGAQI